MKHVYVGWSSPTLTRLGTEAVQINPTSMTLVVGLKDGKITVTAPKEETVTWKSLNPSIAQIDENGVVTPISEGSTKIMITVGEVNYYCTVKVTLTSNDRFKKEVAEANDKITLTYNVDLTEEVTIDKDLILDLNGHSIKGSLYFNANVTVNGSIENCIVEEGILTLMNGTFINVEGGEVIINGGIYKGSVTASPVTINGGKFVNKPEDAIIPENKEFVKNGTYWELLLKENSEGENPVIVLNPSKSYAGLITNSNYLPLIAQGFDKITLTMLEEAYNEGSLFEVSDDSIEFDAKSETAIVAIIPKDSSFEATFGELEGPFISIFEGAPYANGEIFVGDFKLYGLLNIIDANAKIWIK